MDSNQAYLSLCYAPESMRISIGANNHVEPSGFPDRCTTASELKDRSSHPLKWMPPIKSRVTDGGFSTRYQNMGLVGEKQK